MPACLVRILLLMAGIEPNPGPISYFCPVCSIKLRPNSTSVKCSKCEEWVHFRKRNNCSSLSSIKDYSSTYICPSCLNDPFPTQPVPNLVPQPIPRPTANPLPTTPPPSTPNNIPTDSTRNYEMRIMQWNW